MSVCTHRLLVLGTTLDDAAQYAAGEAFEGNVSLVSYSSLDRLRGMEIRAVRVSPKALDDKRYPVAAYQIRQAMAWHVTCSCDGTHADCRGCGTAEPYIAPAKLDELDRPDPRLGLAALIGLLILAVLILGIAVGWFPL